jgi:hypothetical protein
MTETGGVTNVLDEYIELTGKEGYVMIASDVSAYRAVPGNRTLPRL